MHPLFERQLQKSVLDDLAERGVDPVLAAGEIGDPLTMGDCLDERGDE